MKDNGALFERAGEFSADPGSQLQDNRTVESLWLLLEYQIQRETARIKADSARLLSEVEVVSEQLERIRKGLAPQPRGVVYPPGQIHAPSTEPSPNAISK